jgi:hypothetical protein
MMQILIEDQEWHTTRQRSPTTNQAEHFFKPWIQSDTRLRTERQILHDACFNRKIMANRIHADVMLSLDPTLSPLLGTPKRTRRIG